MKLRIPTKKRIVQICITIYVVMISLALGLIGERNYRLNLIKYGYSLGSEKTIQNIVGQIERDPCGEISLHVQNEIINLVESKCISEL